MATYVVEKDSYAGWDSTGKYFGYFGLAAGLVGLTGWAAMHGHLPGLRPADAGDQLLIAAMAWIGCGVFAIMAICVFGSIILSSKSRGTVTIDDVGVQRQIGSGSRLMRWEEIEGFAVMPYGGVTLVPRMGRKGIEVPRYMDDYRGCIAEIKARGVTNLPDDNVQVRRIRKKTTWWQQLRLYFSTVAFLFSYDAKHSHAVRISALGLWIAFVVWMMMEGDELEDRGSARWVSGVLLLALLGWAIYHMARTW